MRSTLVQRSRLFFALLPLRYRPATTANPTVRELQAWHNRLVLREWPRALRLTILAAESVVWPFWAVAHAVRQNATWGAAVRDLSGVGRVRQFVRAVGGALRHRLHPREYYALNLWRPGTSPTDYLTEGRLRHVFRALNRGVDVAVLDDKRRFWEFCRTHRLATPPVLLSIAGGQIEALAEDHALRQDLFFKPCSSLRGIGAARWKYDPASGTYTNPVSGVTADLPTLLAHYRSRRRPYIVQPSLSDHPAIADIGNGTLSVFRVMTAVHSDGAVRELASLFKAPMGRSILTNLSDGALFSPVDSTRGVLRSAFTHALGKPLYDHHPQSGVPVAGRVLPHWRETVELACAAHRQLPGIALIGWDVALTPQGPMLLEGNHTMAIFPFNFPPNPPLGQTELPRLLVAHLRRRYGSGVERGSGDSDAQSGIVSRAPVDTARAAKQG